MPGNHTCQAFNKRLLGGYAAALAALRGLIFCHGLENVSPPRMY